MSDIIDFLNENGLLGKKQILDFVKNTHITNLQKFIEDVKDILLKSNKEQEYTPFSFLASRDISGAGGCTETTCKIERAENLAKFAALYVDKLYIELISISDSHFLKLAEIKESKFREVIKNDLLLIDKYRILINNEIVNILKPYHFCKQCLEEALRAIENEMYIKELENYYLNKVKIKVSYHPELKKILNEYIYEISNVDDIFGHKIYHFTGFITNNLYSIIKDNPGQEYELSEEQITESKLINNILKDEITRLRFQTLESRNLNAKYITSKDFDSYLYELSSNSKTNIIDVQEEVPVYDLPIISGIDIKDILKIRNSEYDSFKNYQIALNKAAKERIKANTKIEMKEIYEDIIYPEFIGLDSKLHKYRSNRFKKIIGKLLFVGGVVTLGLKTGLITNDSTSVLTSIAGASTTANFLSGKNNKKDIEDNDFYFLWKLKNSV